MIPAYKRINRNISSRFAYLIITIVSLIFGLIIALIASSIPFSTPAYTYLPKKSTAQKNNWPFNIQKGLEYYRKIISLSNQYITENNKNEISTPQIEQPKTEPNKTQDQNQNQTQKPESKFPIFKDITGTPPSEEEISNWLVYCNEKLKFKIKYPITLRLNLYDVVYTEVDGKTEIPKEDTLLTGNFNPYPMETLYVGDRPPKAPSDYPEPGNYHIYEISLAVFNQYHRSEEAFWNSLTNNKHWSYHSRFINFAEKRWEENWHDWNPSFFGGSMLHTINGDLTYSTGPYVPNSYFHGINDTPPNDNGKYILDIFKKMLFTFDFIETSCDETIKESQKNWTNYQDQKFNFEIKYHPMIFNKILILGNDLPVRYGGYLKEMTERNIDFYYNENSYFLSIYVANNESFAEKKFDYETQSLSITEKTKEKENINGYEFNKIIGQSKHYKGLKCIFYYINKDNYQYIINNHCSNDYLIEDIIKTFKFTN